MKTPTRTTGMRIIVLAVTAFAALITLGCDDDDGGGGPTTTTLAAPTTTLGGVGTTTTFPASSTSSGSSTTQSTIESSTTTTIIVDGHRQCVVTWSVANLVTLGALQFATDYANAPGEFNGSGDLVECSDNTESLATFNDDDGTRTLTAGMVNLQGFEAPTDIMRCNFEVALGAPHDPRKTDFAITIIDATDPSLEPMTANVVVTRIECQGGGVTTTTTILPGHTISVSLGLAEAVNVGALQFDVDYSAAAPGTFLRAGEDVACGYPTHPNTYASFFNDDTSSMLHVAFASLDGIQGPLTLAECVFTPAGETSADDFSVTVIEAQRPDLTPIDPLPNIAVEVFP